MKSRYEVTLGSTKMSSLNKDLLILDVSNPAPNFSIKQRSIANLDGYDISDIYLEKQEVTVTFELHIYDIVERNEACRAVNEWAMKGGQLKINDRKNMYLTVRCSKFASIESVKNWTDPLSITFVSVGLPYWESTKITSKTLAGKSAKGTMTLDGNYGTALVSIEATATNQRVTAISITCGDTKLIIRGVSVAGIQKLVIDYIDGRFMRVRVGGGSALNKVLPESTDVLKVKCGGSTSISFSADQSMSVLFKARGVYL